MNYSYKINYILPLAENNRRKRGRVAKFTFQELCAQAVGAADYIFLAETFDCVFIENIPKLSMKDLNEVIKK